MHISSAVKLRLVENTELYVLKVIEKTNSMFCLELHTHIPTSINRETGAILNDLGDCCCMMLVLHVIGCENGNSRREALLCFLQLAKESITALPNPFST
jgi:hypothetical protein